MNLSHLLFLSWLRNSKMASMVREIWTLILTLKIEDPIWPIFNTNIILEEEN